MDRLKNTDLHTHSIYSDGGLSPKEVVRRAKRKDVKNLALTDHNSVDGVEEAIQEGKKIGVNVIPAVEVRAQEDEVLGYFIDYKNKKLKEDLEKIQRNLINKVKKLIILNNKKGVKVSFLDLLEEFKPNKNLMEIHLIKYLSKKGYGKIRDLLPKYFSKDGEYYIPWKEISVINTIKLIKKYGGIPVLAHPWVNESSKELLNENNFKKLVKAGLRGIEIDNGDRHKIRGKEVIDRIKEIAKKYNLIITSGSDFHGDYLIKMTGHHEIGNYNCDKSVVEELKKLK